jgi:uncharacterized coiled-coil protein SlyX
VTLRVFEQREQTLCSKNSAADKLLSGLNEFLAETRDPAHPLRGEFHAILERLARR